MFSRHTTQQRGQQLQQQQQELQQQQQHPRRRHPSVESQIARQRQLEWQRNTNRSRQQMNSFQNLNLRLSNIEEEVKNLKQQTSSNTKMNDINYLKTLIIRLTEEVLESKASVKEIKNLLVANKEISETDEDHSTVELLISEINKE